MVEFLKIYVEVVRPAAAQAEPQPNDHLFITFDGKPDTRLGRRVTHLFLRHHKKWGTTTIRGVQETRAEDLHAQNLITVSRIVLIFHI